MSTEITLISEKDLKVVERLLNAGDNLNDVAELLGYNLSELTNHPQLAELQINNKIEKRKIQNKHLSSEMLGRSSPLKVKVSEKGDIQLNIDGQNNTYHSLSDTIAIESPKGSEYLIDYIFSSLPCEAGWKNEKNISGLLAYLHSFDCQDPVESLLVANMIIANSWIACCTQNANNQTLSCHAETYIRQVGKLMNLNIKHVEALDKHRNAGSQTINVKHTHQNVQVNGGQNVFADSVHVKNRGSHAKK